ncbi:MAG TPA: DUF2252 domain-containing protein [Mycolicibacterium fallax]|nr:DUF2252 domain-containing protein [Mycolicibacterium fallax]
MPGAAPVTGLNLRDRDAEVEDPAADLARGRALRAQTPRRALAELGSCGRSATEILLEQNLGRVPDLVGLRMARMLVSPLHFFRGAAAVMAADLAAGPSSNIDVVSCGDAHLSNFGVFASPDRALVFDLNDFDEAAQAPAEWDLKRLVTSVILAARQRQLPEPTARDIAESTAAAYRRALAAVLQMSVLDRFYLRAALTDRPELGADGLAEVTRRTIERARRRTSERAIAKLTEPDAAGTPRFRESPPLTRHVPLADEAALLAAVAEYTASVPVDVRVLLSHFRVTDIAMRVVGVGSVGTRCYLAVLVDARGTPLILQIKQANRSVLQDYGGRVQPQSLQSAIAAHGQGRRVVDGQRILQAVSDLLLGTVRIDGDDFYLRQFHDMKGSVNIDELDATGLGAYGRDCAAVLARAHAQSANASVFHGYFGGGGKAIDAVVSWCFRYADKTVADFDQLTEAARAGAVEVADDPLLG